MISNIPRLVPGWKEPIVVGRYGYIIMHASVCMAVYTGLDPVKPASAMPGECTSSVCAMPGECTSFVCALEIGADHSNAQLQIWHSNAQLQSLHSNAQLQILHSNAQLRILHSNAQLHILHSNAQLQILHAWCAWLFFITPFSIYSRRVVLGDA